VCHQVKHLGGDYILIAKENQPTVREELELFFEDPDADQSRWQTDTSLEKGHGRIEKRVVTASEDMRDWFAKDWFGIEQVFRIERWVTKKGTTSHEVVYGIISLPPKQANAHHIGTLVRNHWAIENRLHSRRDVTMQEDRSQVRTQHVPAILAPLNSTVLALMDLLGVKDVAAQMRVYDARPWEAFQLFIGAL
jgi:predicted transposase YbfD/YdcC